MDAKLGGGTQGSSNSMGYLMVALVCGIALVCIYLFFRIKRCESKIHSLEKNQFDIANTAVNNGFQNPQNLQVLHDAVLGTLLGGGPPPGPSGPPPDNNLDKQEKKGPPPNPVQNLMGMCGFDLLGNIMSSAAGPVVGVNIGPPSDMRPPSNDHEETKIEEIDEDVPKEEDVPKTPVGEESEPPKVEVEVPVEEEDEEPPRRRGRPPKKK